MATAKGKPVYVIFGTDEFLRDHQKAEITAEVLGQADRHLCLSRHGGSVELATVLDDLRTPPFVGERRLVIVDEADDFISTNRKGLEQYLAKPSHTGTLLLMAKSLPSGTRLAKLVAAIGLKVNCSPPEPAGMLKFLHKQARSLDRQLDGPAADLMMQWLGSDLARARSELEKLALYTEGRAEITLADVSAVVVATAGVSPWALSGALAAGDAGVALVALDGLLTQPGEEFRVAGLIGWHLRRLLKAKYMQAAGQSNEHVFRTLKIGRAGQDSFRRLLKRRSLKQVCGDFRQLIRVDLAMKTGRDPKAALQWLVVALCK